MKLVVLFLTLLSTAAFAGDRNNAYDMICSKFPFDTDRNKCINVIKPYNYFDDTGLQLCANFPFDTTKMECLGYIAGKMYERYEMDTCKNSTFDSQKLACLRDNGTPTGNSSCLPNRDVLNQLRSAQAELRNGNYGSVDKRLTYLISQFSTCR